MKMNKCLMAVCCVCSAMGILWSIVYMQSNVAYFACELAFCAIVLAVSVFCTVRYFKLTRESGNETDDKRKTTIYFLLPFVLTMLASTGLIIGIYVL